MSDNANSSSAVKKTITLKTFDEELFDVDEAVAMESGTIKSYFDDEESKYSVVPLPNVTSDILSKVLHYTKKHLELKNKPDSDSKDASKELDADFVKEDHKTIIEMIHAANYLNIKDLLELLNQTVADFIKDMTVEQVREYFGIESDYEPEEEQRLREENKWAFE